MNFFILDIIQCHESGSRINPFFNNRTLQVLDHGFNTEVAHLKRILNDKTLNISFFQSLHVLLSPIEAHKFNLTARSTDGAQREQHPIG